MSSPAGGFTNAGLVVIGTGSDFLLASGSSYTQTGGSTTLTGGGTLVSSAHIVTFQAGTLQGTGNVTGNVSAANGVTLSPGTNATAGTIAITSAAPTLARHKVGVAMLFVVLLTVANLRGVREAGKVFAVPTYGFIAAIFALLVAGLVRCVGGCPQVVVPDPVAVGAPATTTTAMPRFKGQHMAVSWTGSRRKPPLPARVATSMVEA